MQQGNTLFYHGHITSNITRLDERKDKYIHYRISFLRQFCQPIQQKIQLVLAEVKRYKNMRDTQEQVIEKQPEIASLKNEVDQYNHTKGYFGDKLGEYEKKALEFEFYNTDLKKRILTMKKQLKNKQEEVGFQLPLLNKSRVRSQVDMSQNRSAVTRSFALPSLPTQQKYQTESRISGSKVSVSRRKIIDISQKIQNFRNNRLNTHEIKPKVSEQIIKEDLKNQNIQQHNTHRKKIQLLRQRMTNFNNIESLFHDCFEVKKNSVQRSVSQLQSKLITNRQQFLNTCHAVGSKEQSVSYETFRKLSCDQILTLFISFVWLNKKLTAQFVTKRKLIMDFMSKLPTIEDETRP